MTGGVSVWSVFATMVAIAIASNLDNAGVGIAYGVRNIQISWGANLLIAIISGVATFLSGVVGNVVTHYISTDFASWIGAAVVILVGLWVFSEPVRQAWSIKRAKEKNVVMRILDDPAVADFDESKTIGYTEAFVLGIALAMNALAGGFDAGVVRIPVTWTALLVALASYLLLGIATFVGRRYAAKSLGNKATYIAGILLIAVGIHQVW